MPKRGAEQQLSKDDAETHEENEEPGTGFVRANDEEISRRRIVGLPRRAQSAAKLAPPTPQPFTALATPSATPSPVSGLFGPPVASTATSTAKTFASFLGPSPSTNPPATSQPPQTSTPPILPGASPGQDDSYLVKYYTSLRGLNISLLDALTKATDNDPFGDISNVLERYKTLRLDVQNEFDEKSKKSNQPPSTSEKPLFVAKPPAPPSGGFSGFGSFGTSSSTSSPVTGTGTGGFQPKSTPSTATSSGFSFSIPPASMTTPANIFTFPSSSASSTLTKSDFDASKGTATSSLFTFGSSSTFDDKPKNGPSSSSLTWGASPAPGDKDKDAPPTSTIVTGSTAPSGEKEKNTTSSPFVFASSSTISDKEKSASSPFLFGSKTSDKEKPASSPFVFSPSSAGDKEKSTSNPFALGSTPSEKPSSASPFGTTSAPSTSPFTFAKSDSRTTMTSPFGTSVFGTTFTGSGGSEPSSPSKISAFGAFGKPAGSAGSIGNPVGFSFAAPTKVSEGDKDTPDKKESDEGTQDSQTDGAEAEGSVGLITTNPHDEEGAGEEDEDTVHDARSKILRLDKKEGGSSWTDLGVGILRIKKHRETAARRILLRNSGTGKIILNFKLYSGLKPTQNKKTLQFIGHDEKGASQMYTVRLPDEEKATALREALVKEVSLL